MPVLKTAFLFAIVLWDSRMQALLAFRARCLGSPSLSVTLKFGVLDVWSKLFAPQGEAESWGFLSDCMLLC